MNETVSAQPDWDPECLLAVSPNAQNMKLKHLKIWEIMCLLIFTKPITNTGPAVKHTSSSHKGQITEAQR